MLELSPNIVPGIACHINLPPPIFRALSKVRKTKPSLVQFERKSPCLPHKGLNDNGRMIRRYFGRCHCSNVFPYEIHILANKKLVKFAEYGNWLVVGAYGFTSHNVHVFQVLILNKCVEFPHTSCRSCDFAFRLIKPKNIEITP